MFERVETTSQRKMDYQVLLNFKDLACNLFLVRKLNKGMIKQQYSIWVSNSLNHPLVKIKCHCDFTIVFWANLYFIFQMHHAKIFKMRYSKSLYKLFWKYESCFCSEISKTYFTKYPWNHAFAGMKKKNTLTNNTS